MKSFTVELFQDADLPEVLELFYETIEVVNQKDYTHAQIKTWQGKEREAARLVEWSKRLPLSQTFVAKNAAKEMVGFLELETTGELNLFFVHAAYQRLGIGALLMNHLITNLASSPFEKLTANVSITAVPFFKEMGFVNKGEQVVYIGKQDFINYRMEKGLKTVR